MKRILILGAGTAGTMMANKLSQELGDWTVTVVDRDDDHLYQPGLIFLPFGDYRASDLVRPRRRFLGSDVELVLGEIDRIDPADNKVALTDGTVLKFDILVIATGCRIAPEETEGLLGPGWKKTAFDFYTLDGASALAGALERFDGGRLVVNIVDMPIKCPVAPLEFTFLAEAYLTRRGIRDKTELVFATPLDGAFTKPVASAHLGGMLSDRGIKTITDFSAGSVDGDKGVLSGFDGREVPYDLLVTIPAHQGSKAVTNSDMGDEIGFVPTDKHTLQTKAFSHVFALGDATDLPTSKAGSVAHFQAAVLIENILRYVDDLPMLPDFDGHANCFIETGYDKAMLIDFNYETEPLPGMYPLPVVGPFALLKESRVNHWGKLGFRWAYWNILLPGKEMPIDHRMLMMGKRGAA